MTVRTATGLLAWAMCRAGFLSWTSFWHVIYVLPGHEHNERLLRHERCHLEQIERDGRLAFSIKHLWRLLLIPALFVASVWWSIRTEDMDNFY